MWATNYDIIHDTLILLSDLSSSYSSSKALTTLETANALLRNHGPTAFPFMAYPPNFKLRTQFYLTWARMVFSEANVDYFEDFMIPFDNAFETMYQKGNSGAPADEIKHLAVGMFRDLRGVLMAIHNRGAFQMFFDWFYPRYFQILSSAFEQYWEDSFVSIPALKFYEEFAHNKAQRIEFSSSSPNGIILFKETCKILLFYSSSLSKLLTSGNVESAIESDPYKYFLKGMSIVLDALANTLLGSYVNFGVFLFYQDDCYSNTIKGALQLLFCNVDLSRQIMLFDKVSARYYKLIEVLFRNHLPILVDLDSTLFMMLLHTLVDGLYHPDKGISSFAASAIDDLATYRFKQSHRKRKEPAYMKLEQHLMSNNQEDIFFNMLISLFSLILFEGASNLWAFSRPILSLILNHEQYFKQISNNITAQQPDSTRNQVSEAFDSLMENVLPNLETRNRDRFTQNLVFFTGMLKKVIVRPRF